MTKLKITTLRMPTSNLGNESTLPAIAIKLDLDERTYDYLPEENEQFFLKYGEVTCAYPYREQDCYDRELTEKDFEAIVLENEHLKATFLPCFGGKLWSLIDKKSGKDLLFANSVVRPCNLAIRNAWMSGGIEWNCGFRGHHPYTCAPIHTATGTMKDGTPYLRFYYFERVRRAIVQMDFFVPEDADLLYCRMRIENTNDDVIPMYWWSNVAVPLDKGSRVVVPATRSYIAPDGKTNKVDIPIFKGVDVTYPTNSLTAFDYFWDTNGAKRHYITHLNQQGYGLMQASTSLLKGRKLFVWGDSQGGRKWSNFLTADDERGAYAEIQCGLASTQYECLPMPPRAIWEWMEVYGPLQADPTAVHGNWEDAKAEVESRLDKRISLADLEQSLINTREAAKTPADTVIYKGDSWGALERALRQSQKNRQPACHLDFGETDKEQAIWLRLLNEGTVGLYKPDEVPLSYSLQPEWIVLLENAIKDKDRSNWYTYYLLGTAYAAKDNFVAAKKLLKKAFELCKNAWSAYALGVCYRKTDCHKEELDWMKQARALRPADLSLAKEVFRSFHTLEQYELLIEQYEQATEKIKDNNRCRLYYAYALARAERIDEAEQILINNGNYLVIPDIRECEIITTDLWYYIRKKRGIPTTKEDMPPRDLDFRMFSKREGWFENE